MPRPCAAVLTQVVVDQNDPAFQNPTKPIGSFYGKNEAEEIARKTGYTFVEDAGRGWRRVVPSPMPVKIVELPVVRRLLDAHTTVITVGGGGIPVVQKGWDDFHGVAAVIDQLLSSVNIGEPSETVLGALDFLEIPEIGRSDHLVRVHFLQHRLAH